MHAIAWSARDELTCYNPPRGSCLVDGGWQRLDRNVNEGLLARTGRAVEHIEAIVIRGLARSRLLMSD